MQPYHLKIPHFHYAAKSFENPPLSFLFTSQENVAKLSVAPASALLSRVSKPYFQLIQPP